jgi:hypothetical protein
MYDSNYYESVNYTDYLERGDRYKNLAKEVMTFLRKMDMDHVPILDFGCAVGFLLEALKEMKYETSYGVEISEWAKNECHKKDLDIRDDIIDDYSHGVTFILDVLEHMKVDEIHSLFDRLVTNVIVFRIPVCKNEGEDYVLECSRRDPTHNIRWTKEQWKTFFEQRGYNVHKLNLHTIYNSEGVYSGLAVRDKTCTV